LAIFQNYTFGKRQLVSSRTSFKGNWIQEKQVWPENLLAVFERKRSLARNATHFPAKLPRSEDFKVLRLKTDRRFSWEFRPTRNNVF